MNLNLLRPALIKDVIRELGSKSYEGVNLSKRDKLNPCTALHVNDSVYA